MDDNQNNMSESNGEHQGYTIPSDQRSFANASEAEASIDSRQAVERQLEKNTRAISKLKQELISLDQRIHDGEERLEQSRDLLHRYDMLSEKILTMNKKMKSAREVPTVAKQEFDKLVLDAVEIEKQLAQRGINSPDDFNRLLKTTKNNRELFTRYNEMVTNIEKQNEYYRTIALKSISPKKQPDSELKTQFKALAMRVKKEYNLVFQNYDELKSAVTVTEDQIKQLHYRQNIARELYEDYRKVEKSLNRYEACRHKMHKLNEMMLDSNGNLKDPARRDYYLKNKHLLDKQMRLDFDFLRRYNVSSVNDFEEKDSYNKNEMREIESILSYNQRKMQRLIEMETVLKRMLK